ncbi:MAG TPA: 2-oxoacid:acceptor oxidoreductase family protein [Bacteriovoracaceae bacterium]|nr:2-oxoacid:acceptor oxidoreductase family protein [Bacteriovoracaceae bacterium]
MSYKILNGNELLIQGALEAGFHLYTGYPGSPLADFFNILYEDKDEMHKKGIRVVIANSEANAAAMASGAKMAGQNVLVAMKSMGLHVASDALSVGNFANPGQEVDGKRPGVVVVVGDDPWSISTSTPADSRYLFKHLHIPFLEPSTPQELKDWMAMALELSQNSSVYAGILLTTFMAEGGGRVEIGEEKKVDHELVTLNPKDFNLTTNVMVPPNSLVADKDMILRRFPKVREALKMLALDQVFGDLLSETGIIASGGVFETLKQVLEESGLIERVSLYKAASAYPLNEAQLVPYLKGLKTLIVVEEKRGFLEGEINEVVLKHSLTLQLFGKEFKTGEKFVPGFPAFGGLSYEIIYKQINLVLDILEWNKDGDDCHKALPDSLKMTLNVPRRLPTFCPGCPHRETLSIMKDVRAVLDGKDINLISHGDVGCYSLSFLEPFKEMHDLSAMGQGGALGAGTDLFTTNPSVVLMGDSTFFHSGMISISNSVQMGHNITYILLDNDNTAMTGHQVTPRSGLSVEGDVRPRQNMLDVARSLMVSEAIEINPSDRYFYKNLLLKMVQEPGVKVIVSNKECGLTFHGRNKRDERKLFAKGETQSERHFYQINTLACEDCRACVDMTGCPGLSQTFDAYGTKVNIDPQICVSDSYCTKIKACPSFELVKVYDYHPTKYQAPIDLKKEAVNLTSPSPVKDLESVALGSDFRAIVIGVGGSGVTTISRVLAEAATDMAGRNDLDFKFVDQKGLAQRNGSVTCHVSIFSHKKSHGPLVPMGTADIVVSPDLLEGARALEYLSPTGTLIIDSDYQVPLSILLDRGIESDVVTAKDLQAELIEKLGDRLIMAPMKSICFERFQRPVYSSAMILGIAYQAGKLPFSISDLEKAFASAVPKAEFNQNWQAFILGREWYSGSSTKVETGKLEVGYDMGLIKQSVMLATYPWQNKDKLVNLWRSYTNMLALRFARIPEAHLAQYVHDLIVYDQGRLLPEFYEKTSEIKTMYQENEHAIALRILAKTYWIKDEVFVSHLMISPIKTAQDKQRYGSIGTSYKVVHINRPAFVVMGKKIEFDFSPRSWMLKVMRHLRSLRLLMPSWHKTERKIACDIRIELMSKALTPKRLRELDNVKGYREIRYQSAKKHLGHL